MESNLHITFAFKSWEKSSLTYLVAWVLFRGWRFNNIQEILNDWSWKMIHKKSCISCNRHTPFPHAHKHLHTYTYEKNTVLRLCGLDQALISISGFIHICFSSHSLKCLLSKAQERNKLFNCICMHIGQGQWPPTYESVLSARVYSRCTLNSDPWPKTTQKFTLKQT